MKKVAIIICGGNIYSRKGLINASLSRASSLRDISDFDIDVYNIQTHTVKITKTSFQKREKTDKTILQDGFQITLLHHTEYYSNINILKQILLAYNHIFHTHIADISWVNKFSRLFSKYDLLSVHSTEAAYLAATVKKKYGIPFCVTWHGSDIHTRPMCDSKIKQITKALIEAADYNFFVSKKLCSVSETITECGRKTVLYNGYNSNFIKYDSTQKKILRRRNGIDDETKLVAFAGTVREIKNVMLLPDIFKRIKELYKGKVSFWIIGDGGLREAVDNKMKQNGVACKIWGNQPVDAMPDLLNCIDLLILPSKNEGFPLITLETMACGANVIGANVGGIPEAIGEDFCFTHGETFVDGISKRANELLNHPETQNIKPEFTWTTTAQKELSIYKSILES